MMESGWFRIHHRYLCSLSPGLEEPVFRGVEEFHRLAGGFPRILLVRLIYDERRPTYSPDHVAACCYAAVWFKYQPLASCFLLLLSVHCSSARA